MANTLYQQPVHSGKISHLHFLITGGAGFIGSHLVEYLLTHGAGRVRVLDNFMTGRQENLEPFVAHSAFEFLEGDIRDPETCARACQGMHVVFHQAALPSVQRSIEDPLTTHQINCDGFLNVLWAAHRAGVQRMVYASSSSVYGDARGHTRQEHVLGNPLSPYAVSKRCGELYAAVFAAAYPMELIGLRYFNVFGPRQDPENPYAAVIPKFFAALMHGRRPEIFGDGQQTRDFTFVSNVVQANIKAALVQDPQAMRQVYNVACGRSCTILALYDRIRTLLQQYGLLPDPSVTPVFLPPRAGDIMHSCADISRARQLLRYEPMISWEEGLDLLTHDFMIPRHSREE